MDQALTRCVSNLVSNFMRDNLDMTFFIYLHASNKMQLSKEIK